jgi:hypothetical protein
LATGRPRKAASHMRRCPTGRGPWGRRQSGERRYRSVLAGRRVLV